MASGLVLILLLVLVALSEALPGASQDVGDAIWNAVTPKIRNALGWHDRAAARDAVRLHSRSKQFVEFFCGTGGLLAAALSKELRCSWYDLVVDDGHDLLSAKGNHHGVKHCCWRLCVVRCALPNICVDGARAYQEIVGGSCG